MVEDDLEVPPGPPGPVREGLGSNKETPYGPPEFEPPPTAEFKPPPDFVQQLHKWGYTHMSRHCVQLNGKLLISDLPPIMTPGRILIPVRAIANSLGATVEWDPDEKTVTITRGETVIVITIEEEEITVNGVIHPMDVPAQIFAGRTFVPLRFVAQALSDDVIWNPVAKQVIIISRNANPEQE